MVAFKIWITITTKWIQKWYDLLHLILIINVLAPYTTKLLKSVLLLIDKVVVLDNELTLDDKTFKLLLVLLMFK